MRPPPLLASSAAAATRNAAAAAASRERVRFSAMVAFAAVAVAAVFANAFATAYVVLTLKMYQKVLFENAEFPGLVQFSSAVVGSIAGSPSSLDLAVVSNRNVDIAAGGSAISIGEDGIRINARKFEVRSRSGERLFTIDGTDGAKKTATLSANKITKRSKHVSLSSSSVSTQWIRSGAGNDLTLSSPTHLVAIDGPQSVAVSSFGGGIRVEAVKDVKIAAQNKGKILLEGTSLRILQLATANITDINSTSWSAADWRKDNYHWKQKKKNRSKVSKGKKKSPPVPALQLCACRDGKVFAAESDDACRADYHVCPNDDGGNHGNDR